MMITIFGLPPSTQYADVKELMIWKCNLSDYILDSIEDCADGTKKVRVGLVNETEATRLVKCLDGYRLFGHVIKAVAASKSSESKTIQQIQYDPLKFFQQRHFLLPNPEEEDRRPIKPPQPAQKGNHADNHYRNETKNQYSNQADNSYNNQACNQYNNQDNNIYSKQDDTIYSNRADNIYSNCADNIYSNRDDNIYSNRADNICSNPADNQAQNHYSHQHNNQSDIQRNNQGPSNQPVRQSTFNSQPGVTSHGHNSSESVSPGPGLFSSWSDQDISRRGPSELNRPLETVQNREMAPQGTRIKLSGAGRRRLAKLKAEGKLSYQVAFEAGQKSWSVSSVEIPNVPKPPKNNLKRGFEEESHYENQRGRCDEESPYKHQKGRFEMESHHGNQRGRCDEESPYERQRGRFEEESHHENHRGRCDEGSPYQHQRSRFEEESHHENQRGRCDEESPYKRQRGRFEEESHHENHRGRCDEGSPYQHQRSRFEKESHHENQSICDEEYPYNRQRGRFAVESHYENQRTRFDEEFPYKSQRGRFEEESLHQNEAEAPMGISDPPPRNGVAAKGYPRVGICNYEPMTKEQMTLVNAALSSTISEIGRSVGTKGSGPKFHGVQYKAGWLLITCEDRESQEWLTNEVPRCRPWPEARLSVMEERELPFCGPRLWTAAAFIPLTEAGSASEAMDLIGYQNKGLYPEHWKIFCEKVNTDNIFAIFSLDEHSADTLLKSDCRVYIGMKRLWFKLKTKSKVSSKPGNVSAGEKSSIQVPSKLENDLRVPGPSGLGCGPAGCSTPSMDHTDPRPGGLGGAIIPGQTEAGETTKRSRKRARRKGRKALASANHQTE